MNVKIRGGLAIIVGLLFVAACLPEPDANISRALNCTYLRETIGAIILKYHVAVGYYPDTLTAAINASPGTTLPNRGDKFGRAMIYQRDDDGGGFELVSAGSDRLLGTADDERIRYRDGWRTACEQ